MVSILGWSLSHGGLSCRGLVGPELALPLTVPDVCISRSFPWAFSVPTEKGSLVSGLGIRGVPGCQVVQKHSEEKELGVYLLVSRFPFTRHIFSSALIPTLHGARRCWSKFPSEHLWSPAGVGKVWQLHWPQDCGLTQAPPVLPLVALPSFSLPLGLLLTFSRETPLPGSGLQPPPRCHDSPLFLLLPTF